MHVLPDFFSQMSLNKQFLEYIQFILIPEYSQSNEPLKKCSFSPLDGMLVYHTVTPSIMSPGTHLYTNFIHVTKDATYNIIDF